MSEFDAVDWTRLEGELPDPNLMDDDNARHLILGCMTAASTVGIRADLWDAITASVPGFAQFRGKQRKELPEIGSLEWTRECDLVVEAVPVAEQFLRDWLQEHSVPYLTAPVMCPAHGLYMYVAANDLAVAKTEFGDETVHGLNPVMMFDD
jgi:hypothetical protein